MNRTLLIARREYVAYAEPVGFWLSLAPGSGGSACTACRRGSRPAPAAADPTPSMAVVAAAKASTCARFDRVYAPLRA